MLCMERGQTLISNKLKKLIKIKRNTVVKTIIGTATPSDLKDSHSSTLLHLAILYDNYELAEYSIDVGCNVNAQDILKNTPLTLALSATPQWNPNLIKRLLEADADIFLNNQANKCLLYMMLYEPPNVPRDLIYDVFEWFVAAMNRRSSVDNIVDLIVQAKCKLCEIVLMRNAEWTNAVLQQFEIIDWEDSKDSIEQAIYSIDLPNTQALVCYGPGANNRLVYFFQRLQIFAAEIKGRNLRILEAFVKDIAEWRIWDMNGIEVLARMFETAEGTRWICFCSTIFI